MKCLKCKKDLSHFANLDYIYEDIECPACGYEMFVEYGDLRYDDGSFAYSYWLTDNQD